MYNPFALRRLALNVSKPIRSFSSTSRTFIQVGDRLPPVELVENSPGNKVNLSEQITKGKALIIGVPAAFSPSCSESHIPGYINHKKFKTVGDVYVVSVNDAFVMKAWGASIDPTGATGIRFLGDPSAEFTNSLDLAFDGTAIFGGARSKRYVLELEDGKVTQAHVEPDNTGVNISAAGKVLG